MKPTYTIKAALTFLLLGLLPQGLSAAEQTASQLDLTGHWVGWLAIGLFVLAYALVMAEEFTQLRKSKPVIIAAGLIWGFIAWVYAANGLTAAAEHAVRHNLLEYAELMLFLLVAMTYINAMEERRVFEALRARLVRSGFGFRSLFWITGILAFFISPIADNLTTALLCTRAVGPHMLARGSGKVINVSSYTAHGRGGDLVLYTAAKTALTGFTRSQALEWAAHGVQVNCIAPGIFPDVVTTGEEGVRASTARAKAIVPLGRPGQLVRNRTQMDLAAQVHADQQPGEVVNERLRCRWAYLPYLVRPGMIQLVGWHRLLRDEIVVVDYLYSDLTCQSTFLKMDGG